MKCFFVAERVKPKLNSASPTMMDLNLGEFNPPDSLTENIKYKSNVSQLEAKSNFL